MYPILYRRRTRTGFLAGLLVFALLLRVLCQPNLRERLWEKARAVLGSEALFRAVIFLETGLLPEKSAPAGEARMGNGLPAETASPASSEPVAQTEEPAATEAAASSGEAPSSETAQRAEQAAEQPLPAGPAPFTPAEAEAIGLRGSCSYQVDKAELLLRPLNWPQEPGPRVLIIHSHSCESYTQSEGHTYLPDANFRTLDLSCNMIAVGDALLEELGKLGVEAVHDRTLNDYPSYNRSYAVAREKIGDWLEEYPSIVMVLDLHRDALEQPVRETVERDGQVLAPLMLVVGTDEGGLSHPHWPDNLSCALKLQALGNRDQPSLFKRISFRASRFNGDMSPGALIVEVGSTENTLEEACASMPYLARYVEALLRCK